MNRPSSPALNRRDLLKFGIAGTGALLSGDLGDLCAAEKADPYGGFKMGLQSYSLRGFDAKTALKHTRRLGLHYWEAYPRHIPMGTLPKHIQEQKALLRAADVTLASWGVVGFEANETKAREVFDFAKAMGLLSISANPKKDKATFDLLDKLVDEYQIPIAIHNHGPGALYDKIDDVVQITKDRHPLVGACVDTGHYLRSNEKGVDAIDRLGKRVFGVHLKDVKSYRTEAEAVAIEKTGRVGRRLTKEQKFFTILGEGDLDVVGCLKSLRKLNYERCVALEYEENKDNPLSDIEVCLATVRKAVKKLG